MEVLYHVGINSSWVLGLRASNTWAYVRVILTWQHRVDATAAAATATATATDGLVVSHPQRTSICTHHTIKHNARGSLRT